MRYTFLTRWKFRIIVFWSGWDIYKRTFEVSAELWESANGKRPLPDAKRCRELSNKLAGVNRNQ